MLGLSAYGSGSDSDDGSDTESTPTPKTTNVRLNVVYKTEQQQPSRTIPSNGISTTQVPDDDEEMEVTQPEGLKLPSASSAVLHASSSITADDDDKLEDFLMKKRDWETKIGEANKAKMASKGTRKLIDAFGAFSATSLAREEKSIFEPANKSVITKPKPSTTRSAMLAMLPPPSASKPSKSGPAVSTTSFMPTSVRNRQFQPAAAPPAAKRSKPAVEPVEEVSDEPGTVDDGDSDFLGLGSVRKTDLIDFRNLPRPSASAAPTIFLSDDPVGPALPAPAPTPAPEPEPEGPTSSSRSNPMKFINDEQAKKLIYKHELEQWSASNVFANDAVADMVDVSVDRVLGPDVRETVLRNIDHSKTAAFAAVHHPAPVKSNKLAKMKHQITHLASLAVARDDQLKEQWAASRESKAASKRKYGF